MECPNRSLRKAGECVVLRTFETHLGKSSTTWSAFIVCHPDQRPPGIPPHLCADPMNSPFLGVTSLGFSSNWKRNPFARECWIGQWVPVWGKNFGNNHLCTLVCAFVWTQGSDQRLPSSLESLQGCSIHHVDRLQWKIKRNTCVLLGSEHPGRRVAILNCLWEFMTRSNGGKVR